MLLKVGELAKRCGITIRALHHYDAIGLLRASARSDTGYRLYNRDDIVRLHQIQALRRFGMSLTDIGALLAKREPNLHLIVERQIDMLSQQIEQTTRLRDRLVRLRGQLLREEEPDLADWLTTLELVAMYDKYFSQDELNRLPLYSNGNLRTSQWQALVREVGTLMASGASPRGDEAQQLARRWMMMLGRDTCQDPNLLAKLNEMHAGEPSVQIQTGISPEMMAFVQQAFAQTKLTIYAKYLSPDELVFMQENYAKHASEWPGLISSVRQHMEQGRPADDPAVQQLAKRWLELFHLYAGDGLGTQARIRMAHEREPALLDGTLIDGSLLTFVQQAMRHTKRQ